MCSVRGVCVVCVVCVCVVCVLCVFCVCCVLCVVCVVFRSTCGCQCVCGRDEIPQFLTTGRIAANTNE